ncbi:ATP-binding protein [Desulfococcaceae bacterium HSG8]|nr:ATP-binding protein [Desulfococcaceae bacterium HSG8]
MENSQGSVIFTKRARLSRRLLINVVSISAFFTLLTTGFQLYIEYDRDRAAIFGSMQFIENSYVRPISSSAFLLQKKQVRLLLRGAHKLQDIVYLEVSEMKKSGNRVWITQGNPKARRDITRIFPLVYDDPTMGRFEFGTLLASASLEGVYKRLLNRSLIILGLNAVKTFLASLCILIFIQFRITRHLVNMAAYTKKLNLEQLNNRLVLSRKKTKVFEPDELDKVVCAINQMQSRIKADISRREEAERALRASEERFDLAMRFANDGIYDWNLETNEIYYSAGWKKILGYEDDEIRNEFSEWERLTRPEDVKDSWSMMNELLDGKRERFEKEFRMLHKEGHWVDILSRANIVCSDEGKPVRVVGTHVDISALKRAEEQLKEYSGRLEEMVEESTRELRETQKELLMKERLAVLGHLAGSISHEIRNPLAVIDSSVYLLKMKFGDGDEDEKTLRHFGSITSNVKKATAIIESLLNLTRMEKPRTETHNFSDLATEILASVKLPDTIETITDYPEDDVYINADAEQIRMALKNIIKNAVQAMDGSGTITVSVRSPETGTAELVISDSGPGISPENHEEIFQPLFTTKAQGIGFGLSITKMIVEKHGGMIQASSAVGGGAVFAIALPIAGKGAKNFG